jgi:hypothetical protein
VGSLPQPTFDPRGGAGGTDEICSPLDEIIGKLKSDKPDGAAVARYERGMKYLSEAGAACRLDAQKTIVKIEDANKEFSSIIALEP